MRSSLSIRLVIATTAIAATLAAALGTFVVIPVNDIATRAGQRAAAAEATLAAAALRAGGGPVAAATVCRVGAACARGAVRLDATTVAAAVAGRAPLGGHRGRVAWGLAGAGAGRAVLVVVDRGGAMERRERIGLLLALAIVLTSTLGCALWAGASYARRLGRVARVARRIADGDLTARAEIAGRDELGLLGRDVDRMAERLAALERTRSEFVAKVSHDLRTPLTVIRGYAFTLRRRAEDPDDARRLDAIGRETDRLASLVDDLLTLSQAGAGALRVTMGRMVAADLLEEVAERVAPLALEHGVEVTVETPFELELDGDRRRLAQVLTNLATNAIRHTPAGGTVQLIAERRPDGPVVLRVEDTGTGIDPAGVERLLRPFEHGDGPGAGSGLGLAIARELVGAHGGRLRLAPRAGGGTVATVELPGLHGAGRTLVELR
jgi:two-component system sensor histidine kinase BaeS